MFCPKCGNPRASEATTFCSKCGLRLTEVSQWLSGVPEKDRKTRLRKGLLQSYCIFLAVPIVFIIGLVLDTIGYRPGRIAFPLAGLLLLIGVFRISYALIFQSKLLGVDDHSIPDVREVSDSHLHQLRNAPPTAEEFLTRPLRATQEEPLMSVTDRTTKDLKVNDQ